MLATATPVRSIAQRMEALARANEIRSRRATLKRDLKAGRVAIGQLLVNPPEWLETAKVFDILLAVPKYGRVKVNKALQVCRISPFKTFGGMSLRQRAELISTLEPAQTPPAPRRNAPRPSPETLTWFEREVLGQACELGSVVARDADRAADALCTAVNSISRARGSLQRRGLLDDFGQPTPEGRAMRDALVAA